MNIIKKITKNVFGQKIIGFIVYLITKFIFYSIRWSQLKDNNKDIIFKKKQPYIFCCWHNRLFLGPYLLPKHNKINALQSVGIVVASSPAKMGETMNNEMEKFLCSMHSQAISPFQKTKKLPLFLIND